MGPPPNPKDTVDHIDRNASNNNVDNLRWATRSAQRLNSGNGLKSTAQAVCVTTPDGSETIYRSITEAGKAIGIDSAQVSHALRSKGKGKVSGCTVKYAPPEPQDDLEGEIWAPAYCDPKYMVSTLGRMQRQCGTIWHYKYTPTPIKSRAYVIIRFKDGPQLLHRVIKITFDGFDADPSKSYVDHVNRNSGDNRLSNLEWTTASTNMKNRVLPPKGSRC